MVGFILLALIAGFAAAVLSWPQGVVFVPILAPLVSSTAVLILGLLKAWRKSPVRPSLPAPKVEATPGRAEPDMASLGP